MLFELNNQQRLYLGLTPIEENWEKVQINNIYLYFDGDTIRKKITVTDSSYNEQELNERTAENRTLLSPKTAKGKAKKLNFTAIQSFSFFGVYFSFTGSSVSIANYTTQTTYYSEHLTEKGKIEALKQWLTTWISETTESDLIEISAFKIAKRKHCKFKEGDFFAFKLDRRNWAFGRILIDIAKRKKTGDLKDNKHYGLTNLMGRPLIIKVYHHISNTLDVDLSALSHTLALPSQAVMDNQFYYGENLIIGHKPLTMEEQDMLISYSKSISLREPNTIYLQYGFIFKEANIADFDKYLVIEESNSHTGYNENPYRNESIGFGIDTQALNACITEKSNQPYWNSNHHYNIKYDLRNPANIEIKREIFKFFGLDADKNYNKNSVYI